ncbi:RNA polymerase sigma factor SigJ [Paenibacillus sp. N3/727]|uniref:RNA polymerase sigma factor SigJ n=1 Tax=Paenibacillus sp. N3/727 TaxID=2925845 RepID=UPI001F53C116|nr:RNA polymerase sigma factor SigJ [Paenibacillus sp. N3/727]UNK16367.1 RNA polymerase sigma factor SigJ [Paenibacillus sp. N3/727]
MKELYTQYKGLLFNLAYQMTGSVSDAEDVVQDVFVKVIDIDSSKMTEPKAYLCKMATNRCLDIFKSAKRRREQYFGYWLPEPILMTEDESYEQVVRDDMLSYAMLVLLERLSPSERAVFVLREALDFDYSVIAELIEKNELNCRKLMSRARRKMGISEEDLTNVGAVREEWIGQFLAALSQGHVDSVLSLLAENAEIVSDGGGKVSAAVRPIKTRELVARFLLGIISKVQKDESGSPVFELARINNQTGIIFREGNHATNVVLMNMKQDLLQNIYIIRNPEKLTQV